VHNIEWPKQRGFNAGSIPAGTIVEFDEEIYIIMDPHNMEESLVDSDVPLLGMTDGRMVTVRPETILVKFTNAKLILEPS